MSTNKINHQDAAGFIPLYRPDLSGNERTYVNECLETSWISSNGAFVGKFEEVMAEILQVRHAISLSNGTVALHLALHCLGIGPGDEVIVPTFTYIASVNTIAQTGATPVFVDCRQRDWLIDATKIESLITSRTKAIVAVHLYGSICDMDHLRSIARDNRLYLIEDCAESLGSTLDGRSCGGLGDIGTFSFFGNKTLTTGEGGLVTTDDDMLAARLRLVKGQGQSLTKRYWHVELGFNYRMTNICAAIGLAQAEIAAQILENKRKLAGLYRQKTSGLPVTYQQLNPNVVSSEWLITLLLPDDCDREAVMNSMARDLIETRPTFYCAHQMPMYQTDLSFPNSENISRRGLSLPSYPALEESQVERVVTSLNNALNLYHRGS